MRVLASCLLLLLLLTSAQALAGTEQPITDQLQLPISSNNLLRELDLTPAQPAASSASLLHDLPAYCEFADSYPKQLSGAGVQRIITCVRVSE